eukprot:2325381-Pleurochrysis_carterae.AAC.1
MVHADERSRMKQHGTKARIRRDTGRRVEVDRRRRREESKTKQAQRARAKLSSLFTVAAAHASRA